MIELRVISDCEFFNCSTDFRYTIDDSLLVRYCARRGVKYSKCVDEASNSRAVVKK